MSLSVANSNYANLSAQAGLYQGTAAIASWLSGLAAANNTNTPSAATNTSTPTISAGYGPNAYNQFRSQVGAATTAAKTDGDAEAAPSESTTASDYQQAVAAYGDTAE